MGSAACAVLDAYFNSMDEFKDSNEARQEYAKDQLYKSRFVYGSAKGNNHHVRKNECQLPSFHSDCVLQKWHGIFKGGLINLVLAHHLIAVKGSQWIYGLPYTCVDHQPRGAIALAATAVRNDPFFLYNILIYFLVKAERALQFWADGTFTIEVMNECRGKRHIQIPAKLNPKTGKQSRIYGQFSAMKWSKATDQYISAINGLDSQDIEDIMDSARESSKVSRRGGLEGSSQDQDESQCRLIAEGSEPSDSENSGMDDGSLRAGGHHTTDDQNHRRSRKSPPPESPRRNHAHAHSNAPSSRREYAPRSQREVSPPPHDGRSPSRGRGAYSPSRREASPPPRTARLSSRREAPFHRNGRSPSRDSRVAHSPSRREASPRRSARPSTRLEASPRRSARPPSRREASPPPPHKGAPRTGRSPSRREADPHPPRSRPCPPRLVYHSPTPPADYGRENSGSPSRKRKYRD